MKFNDTIVGAFFVGLALAMILLAQGFHVPVGQKFGPAFFPTIVAVVMGCGGLVLVAKGLANRRTQPLMELEPWTRDPGRVMNGLAIFGFLIFYLLLSEPLGFLVVAPLAMWGLVWRLWGRPLASLAIAVVASFLIHQFFVQLLLVPLPWGVVPYFKLF